jgi:hypothetical protein
VGAAMRAPCGPPLYIWGCEAGPEGKEEEARFDRATCMAILCQRVAVGSDSGGGSVGRGEAGATKEAVRWTAEASWAGCRGEKQQCQGEYIVKVLARDVRSDRKLWGGAECAATGSLGDGGEWPPQRGACRVQVSRAS